MTRWIDLDRTAALHIAAQVQLSGGGPSDCIPIVKWLYRHAAHYFTERNVLWLWEQATLLPPRSYPGHWETRAAGECRWQLWVVES